MAVRNSSNAEVIHRCTQCAAGCSVAQLLSGKLRLSSITPSPLTPASAFLISVAVADYRTLKLRALLLLLPCENSVLYAHVVFVVV